MPKRMQAGSAVTPAEFKAWRERHWPTQRAAERDLGLSIETIFALETGKTRRGNDYPAAKWVRLMMHGKNTWRKPKHDFPAIQSEINSGETLAAISNKHNISRVMLEHYRKTGRISWDSQRDTINYKSVIDHLKSGLSVRRVAADLGVSATSIYTAIEMGKIPRMHVYKRRPRSANEAAYRRVAAHMDDGMRPNDIARALGLPISTVRSWVNKIKAGSSSFDAPKKARPGVNRGGQVVEQAGVNRATGDAQSTKGVIS